MGAFLPMPFGGTDLSCALIAESVMSALTMSTTEGNVLSCKCCLDKSLTCTFRDFWFAMRGIRGVIHQVSGQIGDHPTILIRGQAVCAAQLFKYDLLHVLHVALLHAAGHQ